MRVARAWKRGQTLFLPGCTAADGAKRTILEYFENDVVGPALRE